MNGTLSFAPLATLPGDRGGIVTSTFGSADRNGVPFFIQSCEGWFTPANGGVPQRAKVVFACPSGKPNTLGGLIRADQDGWPLAHGAPKPTVNGHSHQILARKNRARVECELELVQPADPAVPGSVPAYEAYAWRVIAPVSFDDAPGAPTVRAACGIPRPPRELRDPTAPEETHVDM